MNNTHLSARTVRTESGNVCWKVYLSEGETIIKPQNNTKIIEQGVMTDIAFAQMVTGAIVRKEPAPTIFVPPTPNGYVDGYMSKEDGSLGMVVRIPSRKFQFSLYSHASGMKTTKSYSIPTPNLVYLLSYRNKVRKSFLCFSYREWKGMETELCYYPYGNVSDSGSICMGNISDQSIGVDITDFQSLMVVIEASLLGVTNDDYLTGGKARVLTGQSQYELCESLEKSGAEIFPSNILTNQNGNLKTVSDLCARLHADSNM